MGLTKGILRLEGKPHAAGGFSFKRPGSTWSDYVGRTHTHTDPEKAIAAAEKLRASKIAFHERELARLRATEFTVPE